MRINVNDSEVLTDYVNLFVSVMICFPEVGKIKYDKDSGALYFSFLLKDIDEKTNISAGLTKINGALVKYHQYNRTKSYDYSVASQSIRSYKVLEVKRDMATVTKAEITFLIELFRLEFIDYIMVEKLDSAFNEEYRWYYEESESQRLNDKKLNIDEKCIVNQIVVCREAGKVLVFSN